MTGLLVAEYRKLKSTQVWFWMLLACLAITGLLVIVQLATRKDLGVDHNVREVFTSAYTAYVPAFVLGVLGVTTEFRYQTITPTLLATPSRWRLITAKLIAYTVVGVVYAVSCLVLALVIAVPWLHSKHDVDSSFSRNNVWTALLAIAVIVAMFALIGLGFGALMRNQIAAVSIGLIYFSVAEGLLSLIPYVRAVYKFLPGGAASAILDPNSTYGPQNTYHFVGAFAGFLLLLAWALGLSLLGAGWTMNRDIT
jgi:ABC-2 type transport system permease protein